MQLLIQFWQRERRGQYVAASAEEKKTTKYGELARTHYVAPLAVETSRSIAFGPGAREFFTELGRWLIHVTGDLMSRCHMIQQISVALQIKRQCCACRGAGHHRTM